MSPLSRRDRAALVLAYECVRASVVRFRSVHRGHAIWALRIGVETLPILDAFTAALRAEDDTRLVTARLALLLRVLLRAAEEEALLDHGGPGVGMEWTVCLRCDGTAAHPEGRSCYECRGVGLIAYPLRYTPLWEHAKPHGVAR